MLFLEEERGKKQRILLVINHGAINMETLYLLCIKRTASGRSYLEFSDIDI